MNITVTTHIAAPVEMVAKGASVKLANVPDKSAPIGMIPWKTKKYNPITRPRNSFGVFNCSAVTSAVMEIPEAAPCIDSMASDSGMLLDEAKIICPRPSIKNAMRINVPFAR